MNKQPRQHRLYRLEVRVIEEVDVYKNKEDLHGGPGYYPEEILITFSNTQIADKALPAVVSAVANERHNLIDRCKNL